MDFAIKSIPIVGSICSSKQSFVNRFSILLLPTPLFPSMIIFREMGLPEFDPLSSSYMNGETIFREESRQANWRRPENVLPFFLDDDFYYRMVSHYIKMS